MRRLSSRWSHERLAIVHIIERERERRKEFFAVSSHCRSVRRIKRSACDRRDGESGCEQRINVLLKSANLLSSCWPIALASSCKNTILFGVEYAIKLTLHSTKNKQGTCKKPNAMNRQAAIGSVVKEWLRCL